MKIKFKQLDYAKDLPTPSRGTKHSSSIDLRLASVQYCDHGVFKIGYGVAIEIPYGFAGDLKVRSSWGRKGLELTNAVGEIDCDYRGELMSYATFKHRGFDFPEIGTRIAQIKISEYLVGEIVVVDELSGTDRLGGFGSTGDK